MITDLDKKQLGQDVTRFLAWLRGKLNSQFTRKCDYIVFVEPDPADWFMDVPIVIDIKNPVRFNTYELKKCSFEYYRMIVIHECFHLLVQNIPNKIDAKRLKDDFGDTFMTFLDIEADYYTYLYLEEFHSYELSDIFKLNFEGGKVFGDSDLRFPKYERFISSSMTMVNYFLKKSKNEKEIFLVSIKNIPTEGKVHAVVSKSTHFEAVSFNISQSVSENLRKCYKREVTSKEEYVTNTIQYCSEILGIKIQNKIQQEILDLEDNK